MEGNLGAAAHLTAPAVILASYRHMTTKTIPNQQKQFQEALAKQEERHAELQTQHLDAFREELRAQRRHDQQMTELIVNGKKDAG